MNVPRPLLVLVIVIIVLGVIACGVGVARGRMDAAGPTPTPAVQFDGFGDSAVPPRDVREIGSDCSRSGVSATISVAGVCTLRVDPQSLRPRSLKLLVTGGNVDAMRVTQEIRGETRTSDPDDFGLNERAKISVSGTSPVNVILSCGSCSVQIQG
jgi:hypothetical protein